MRYTIIVGEDRPQTIKVGNVERGSGSTIINEKGETLARRGDVGFPNKCQVWAARAINGKIEKEGSPIDVTDKDYRGELVGLKWHDPKGMLIDVRYIPGLTSLDILYQENRLNYKIDDNKPESADAYYLMYPNGENDFDENADKLLVQHLKWHSYNLKSESKNPNFFTSMFYEKSLEQQMRVETKELDSQFEAGKLVREIASGGDSVPKLKNLFSVVKSITDEEPKDDKLYAYLLMIADRKANQFIQAVENYKKNVSNVFAKLESYEAVDLTTQGTIVAWGKNKKKEIIMTDIPGKEKEMFDYLLENFTDPKVFDATFKLIQITDKL